MNYKRVGLCLLIVFPVYFSTTFFYLQAEDMEDGKTVFESKCSKCHQFSQALLKTKNLKEWKATTLRKSKKKNSGIDPDEAQIIAEYLGNSKR